MAILDYARAKEILESEFASVEAEAVAGVKPLLSSSLMQTFEQLFGSKTQAYREVLLGCVLVRILDPSLNLRLPYAKQGENAYNGRTLDERVVNPFLQTNKIPCSKGPYLSVFRRSITFASATGEGVKDRPGFEAFLSVLGALEKMPPVEARGLLNSLLHRFVDLRNAAHILLSRMNRISLRQCEGLIGALLTSPSGGRFPLFLIVSVFTALRDRYEINWKIEYQGINVSDQATGAGGDVTISMGDKIIFAAEVTERVVDAAKVESVFNSKVSPNAINDYLFLTLKPAPSDALLQAKKYFAHGHEINFAEVLPWIVNCLSLAGGKGRSRFVEVLVGLLETPGVPVPVKLAWNKALAAVAETGN